MLPKIKIVNEPGFTTVSINGQLLPGVRSVSVRGGPSELTTVTLELIGDVEIDDRSIRLFNAEALLSGTPRKP